MSKQNPIVNTHEEKTKLIEEIKEKIEERNQSDYPKNKTAQSNGSANK